MKVPNIRAALAANTEVGAGNVVGTRMALGQGVDDPVVTFDTDIDGYPAWQPLTIRQLDQLAAARAAALHRLGIGMRDPVAVIAPTAADTALTFLALARLGAISALINPFLNIELTAEFVRRLGAVGLITDAAHADQLSRYDLGTASLPEITTLGTADPAHAPPPYRHYASDPVAITHSSGTTGLPKAVVHAHSSLFAAIRYRLTLPRPQGAERMLSALPCPHAAGLIVLNLALCNGGQMLMLSRQAGPHVVDAIQRWQPRSVIGFSTTWPSLLKENLADRDLSSVALWWNTGDCAHEAHIRRLIALGSRDVVTSAGRSHQPGSVFVDGIGSSEMGHSHFHIAHSKDTNRYGRCIGRPHPFADVKVFGPGGEELPPGEVGELGTASPTNSLGYWNDSALTYRTRVRGYFLTGDLVYRDEDGYFYQLDRKIDSVDLGDGTWLYTAACEERILASCPDVLDCTIVAARDGGRVVTDVLLQLDRGADPEVDRTPQIRAALEDHVAATVRRAVPVDDENIPLTPTGKVRKFVLRQRYLAKAAQ
jgi:acyl-coenzyme A synthetase/AMP-(fatty) acid ligase